MSDIAKGGTKDADDTTPTEDYAIPPSTPPGTRLSDEDIQVLMRAPRKKNFSPRPAEEEKDDSNT
jgi:hypothetical protein